MMKFAAALLSLALASASHADMIFSVSDSSVNNCSPHGLWTGNTLSKDNNRCANYFSIDGTLTIADDLSQANLMASAINPEGVVADINLTFANFAETHSYKQEGGIAWDPSQDGINDIDFFTSIAGTISLTDGGSTDSYNINEFAGGFGWQYGIGANAKDPNALGGSAWIRGDNLGTDHWDLNVNLQAVPEPSNLALLAIALVAGFARRRASR